MPRIISGPDMLVNEKKERYRPACTGWPAVVSSNWLW